MNRRTGSLISPWPPCEGLESEARGLKRVALALIGILGGILACSPDFTPPTAPPAPKFDPLVYDAPIGPLPDFVGETLIDTVRRDEPVSVTLARIGVTASEIDTIVRSLLDEFDFRKARPGNTVEIQRDASGNIVWFRFTAGARSIYHSARGPDGKYFGVAELVHVLKQTVFVEGVIEHSLPFAATHVSPAERRMSGRTSSVTLNFSTLELVGTRPSAKERKEMLRLLDELQLRHKEAPAPAMPPAPARRRARKIDVARFEAVLVDCKSLADNTATHTVRRNAFLGKTTSWKADTFVARGSDYDVALIQRDGDLHVHFRSKGRYHSRSTTEDFQRFQAVLDAIGFTHGFNPWPYRLQQWRNGSLKQDRFTASTRLPKTVHAPFDRTLGHSSAPPPIHLVARFFARRSTFSRKISEFLFIFRQAGEERVHLPVRTLAFCSLFEGLVHLLFDDCLLYTSDAADE